MAEKFKIEGLNEIQEALRGLPTKLSNKILYDANKDVLNQVVRPGLKGIPYSARTRRGIKFVIDRKNKSGVFLGVTSEAYWLRFLQKGTDKRFTKQGKKTAYRGRISPRETGVVSTIESRIKPVLDALSNDYSDLVTKAITKQLKKYNKI